MQLHKNTSQHICVCKLTDRYNTMNRLRIRNLNVIKFFRFEYFKNLEKK